ncbi:uncharacterized protein PF3D7_1120600-like isoform X2 [Galleria mellonella]|uniref:Uncharacterized protein PF3D7_1120600-like isoform X2 n=1 Tax=Galleria mellonella TaxID=7137 RepID=A0A6J1WJC4_GALME|nr:uncharacterized protein PF3D7_1120600-like isoform X2 [Galleria mellonella]
MEDIYDNLENYDDLNIINELKTENKSLKLKLEEYALSMDKLQKEFDKLSSEYTKLEMNYSSLLKTARAEVERKTQIITNLNKEKDILILNSRRNKNLLNIKRNMSTSNNFELKKNPESDITKKNIQNVSESMKSNDLSAIRLEETKVPSEDAVTSLNRVTTGKLVNVVDNITKNNKLTSEGISDAKENITLLYKHKDDYQVQRKPCSISNRRKSMPVSRQYSRFTSDEECEDNSREEIKHKKESLSRHDTNRKSRDRSYNSKQSKISDTLSKDDKHVSHHELSKDKYSKTRDNKRSDRSRDRYELRRKRHYSPERTHRKSKRDYPEDRIQRLDYGRNRVLESPPRDRYDQYNRRHLDLRSRDIKGHDDYHSEKYRHQPYERQTGKHKILNDNDEVSAKRLKIDSYNKYNEETVQRPKEVEFGVVHPITQALETNESCQSPDYILGDATSVPPITEIKSIAAIQLEDPRVTNKRYIMKSENGKTVLSTVTGRNVSLEIIDKSVWGIEHVDMPDALVHHPSHYSDELVKEIYVDIDNPVSNLSFESGEILSLETQEGTSDTADCRYKVESKNEHIESQDGIKRAQFEQLEHHSNNGLKTRYKNPKTKATSDEPKTQNVLSNNIAFIKDSSELQVNRNDNLENVDYENLHKVESKIEHIEDQDSIKRISQSEKLEHHSNNEPKSRYKIPKIKATNDEPKIQNVLSNNIVFMKDSLCELQVNRNDNLQNVEKNDHNRKEIKNKLNDKNLFKNRELIEGDLELSDEASDSVESKTFVTNNVNKTEKADCLENTKCQEKETSVTNDHNRNSVEIINDESCKVTQIKNQVENNASIKSDEGYLKGAVKKRPHKSHRHSKDDSSKERTEKKCSKKVKSQKSDTVCKEVKTKFCDLFGDSSSLITPEDLGLTSSQGQGESSKYVPIFEDAQDAVDMNVKKSEHIKISDKSEVQNTEKSSPSQFQKDAVPKSVIENKKRKPKKNIQDNSSTVATNIESPHTCNIPKSEKLEIENDVVKTIIISTGIQPQYMSVTKDHTTVEQQITSDNQNEFCQDDAQKAQDTPMRALATSTPERELQQSGLEKDIKSRIPELISNSNESKIVPTDNVTATPNHSSTMDTLDSQNNPDAPDVRIFVKRRRRTIKKVTPSKT